MKKKLVLFLIVFVSFCNLAFVNAAEGGTVTIRQSGTAGTQGSYNGQICKKDVIVNKVTVASSRTYTSSFSEAKAACQRRIDSLSDKNGTEQCTEIKYVSNYKWSCTTSSLYYGSYIECKSACSSCKFKKVFSNPWYTWKIVKEVSTEGELKCQAATLAFPTFVHEMDAGNGAGKDAVYCLQPGKGGPAGGTSYVLSNTYDFTNCKGVYTHFYCGLGQLLYYNMKQETDADGNIYYVDAGTYDYATMTAALRMWVAYYSKNHGSGLGGMDSIGMESDGFDYYTNTPLYENTVTLGQKNVSCSAKTGTFCGNGAYNSALDLIERVKNTSDADFLGGEEERGYILGGSIDRPEFTDNGESANGTLTVTATFNEETQKKLKIVAGTCDEANKIVQTKYGVTDEQPCVVNVLIKDAEGNIITTSSSGAKVTAAQCTKEKCTFDINYQIECQQTENAKGGLLNYSFDFTIKQSSTSGYLRIYVNGDNNKQVMATAAFNTVKAEDEGKVDGNFPQFSYSANINCECDPSQYCDEFETHGNRNNGSCGGGYDTFEKYTHDDPYMNCIINACNDSKKFRFRYTDDYGLDKNICDLYCRDEVTFYLANKTIVYAGMQFDYDIGPLVLQDGEVEEVLGCGHKLTSVILQKRQCTTEVYYDVPNKYGNGKSWQEQYQEAIEAMGAAFATWKYWEAAYDWQLVDNGGKPHEVVAPAVSCDKASPSGCGGGCSYGYQTYPEIEYILYWPDSGSIPYKTYYEVSKEEVVFDTDGNSKINWHNDKSSTSAPMSGKYNEASSCDSDGCDPYACDGPDEDTDKDDTCYRDTSYSTDGTCKKGEKGDYNYVKNMEESTWNAYRAAVKEVERLIFELQNCNLYTNNNSKFETISFYYGTETTIESKYHGSYNPKGEVEHTSAKDILLEEAACDNPEDCISMKLRYDDELYGNPEMEFETEVDLVDSKLNENDFCTDPTPDNNYETECYKFISNTEKEITGGNSVKKHDLLECNAGVREEIECKKYEQKMTLPANDFAKFITVTESVFWHPKKYQVETYTGLVTEGSGDGSKYAPLGNEVFPVSNNSTSGKTGTYTIEHFYENIGLTVNDKYSHDYMCSYDVLNVTKLYDCKTDIDGDGAMDLNYCKNQCYYIHDGVPAIDRSCNNWTPSGNSPGYGFFFRSVDASDLFPNEDLRDPGQNWSKYPDVIGEIEATSSELFVNDSLLEYRYILTPTAIDRIREYNEQMDLSSGYLNNTLTGCMLEVDETGLEAFKNCSSSFLEKISYDNNEFDVQFVGGGGMYR